MTSLRLKYLSHPVVSQGNCLLCCNKSSRHILKARKIHKEIACSAAATNQLHAHYSNFLSMEKSWDVGGIEKVDIHSAGSDTKVYFF